jgi:hypothetical protein
MRTFTYQALPMRVVFGIGALRKLPDEVENLGLSRVLVLCSPEQEAMGRCGRDGAGGASGRRPARGADARADRGRPAGP